MGEPLTKEGTMAEQENNLHDMSVDAYLRESVVIDEIMNLDEDMRRISGDLAYWNMRFADGNKEHLLLKIEMDRLFGMLYLEHREKLELLKGKVTESMVKAAVDTDERWHDMRVQVIEAEAERIRLRGVCDAVVAKKDMLQSIGAKLRIEMSGDPTIRDMASSGRNVRG